jgi:hypothetical protein
MRLLVRVTLGTDTPAVPTLAQITQVTEGKLDELLAEVERLRGLLALEEMNCTRMADAFSAESQRAEVAERELAIDREFWGRCVMCQSAGRCPIQSAAVYEPEFGCTAYKSR